MIKHEPDRGNLMNQHRFTRLKQSKKRFRFDGLSSLDTQIVQNVYYKTHVRLKVQTYKTGLQVDLEKTAKRRRAGQAAALRPVLNKTAVKPNGTGTSLNLPGIVIINSSKKKT